jgi:hypothetical protein
MQPFLSKIFLFFAIVFITSSCNHYSGVNITKRHYSKGNYVSVTKGKKSFLNHQNSSPDESLKIAEQKELQGVLIVTHEEKTIVANANQNSIDVEFENSNRLEALIIKQDLNYTNEAPKKVSSKSLQKFKKGHSILKNKNVNDDDEGRSLFWLVITILLTIWLIGLLSGGWGLGGLINLLLLIALILFILWLLRLI